MYLKSFTPFKEKKLEQFNYYAVRIIDKKRKTVSIYTFQLDENRELKKLPCGYEEFLDVDIFGVGQGICYGNCPYCYLGVSKNKNQGYVKKIDKKIIEWFKNLNDNQRPFQVALPGSGEFFEHPEWNKVIDTFEKLNIIPNITSNGMFIERNKNELDKIKNYLNEKVGGIAISLHEHLKKYWKKTIDWLEKETESVVNLHFIVSDKNSIDKLKNYYSKYIESGEYKSIKHITLLPFGEGLSGIKKNIDYNYLAKWLLDLKNPKLTYGANFYEFLKNYEIPNVNIYLPHTFSGFLDLNTMIMYNNSFELKNKC